jgi:hypothetical protein
MSWLCNGLTITVRSIAEHVNIDREPIRKILIEYLDMRKTCAKIVPNELTEEKNKVESQFARTFCC